MTQPDSDKKPEGTPPAGPLPRSPVQTDELQPANEAEAPPDDPKNEET